MSKKIKLWLHERNLKTMEATSSIVEREAETDWFGANNKSYWYEVYVEPPAEAPLWRKILTGNFWVQFWPQLIAGGIISGVMLWLTIQLTT